MAGVRLLGGGILAFREPEAWQRVVIPMVPTDGAGTPAEVGDAFAEAYLLSPLVRQTIEASVVSGVKSTICFSVPKVIGLTAMTQSTVLICTAGTRSPVQLDNLELVTKASAISWPS